MRIDFVEFTSSDEEKDKPPPEGTEQDVE